MIGVYKITNMVNNKAYIGISVDILHRWRTHCNTYRLSREFDKSLYKAMRKYGITKFSFEIIELCEEEQLHDREVYWINKFNTYYDGYNETFGGDIGGFSNNGENHANHKLTEEDIIDIRSRYNNHERKKCVYELYKDKINYTGFHKIWLGKTWKHIMPEVFSESNIAYHTHDTGNTGTANGRAILTAEDVKTIRHRRDNGDDMKTVYNDYESKISYKYMYNIWTNITWKNIV